MCRYRMSGIHVLDNPGHKQPSLFHSGYARASLFLFLVFTAVKSMYVYKHVSFMALDLPDQRRKCQQVRFIL